jgi:hypothetical protein
MFVYLDTRNAIGILLTHGVFTNRAADIMLFIDLTRTTPSLSPQKLRVKA